MVKSMSWTYFPTVPRGRSMRRVAATLLRGASFLLGRMARQLLAAERRLDPPRAPAQLEFYAEAGAPEGALYADGRLVGYIEGLHSL